MLRFHRRCGDRVTLLQNNLTAIRNFIEFNHGLILSEEPLRDDIMFEVCIDRKVNVWNGSIEIGVTTLDPEFTELPATATKLRNSAWIMSGSSIVRDGITFMNSYGPELDSLREGDCVGVMRTSRAELMFFVNGRCLGVAAQDMPTRLFAVVDMYGQCVQVSIMQQTTNGMRPIMESSLDQIEEDPNNDDTLTSSDVEGAAAQGDSAYPKDYREDYVPMTSEAACALIAQDRIRFHPRCGILVLLSNNNKSAERARPLDDYNNGVVMTHRPLYDDEIFEIRIDRLVDKWSGSIEVGVTSHNPATIRFPSTMTNMDSGTVMLSGCKVLINGHGTCMEYGNFNLDELRVGDTIGMMRKSSGQLHYYINGIDQGVAADKVDQQVWGVVDLYGMTVKVSIVDPFEEVDTNINDFPPLPSVSVLAGLWQLAPAIDEDSLLFHTLRASNVIIINDGKTAHRPNAFEYFNNGIVMTNRTLRTNELFQVRLDLVIPKWAGSIEIGVTRHTSNEIQFPFKMSNAKSGTWAMTGEDVIRDGSIIIPQYVRNLNRLVEGDTVGVMRRDMGILHFYVNGVDQGPAAFNIPEQVFGIIDLYGRVAQATIVDNYPVPQMYSPESPVSTESNITSYPEMCFHRVHGRNALLSRTRLTASRATVYSEFNDAVLFSSRPLRECDMFELRIDCMVDCWIGSIEMGVTAIRPEDLEASGGVGALAGTATDLNWDTYILSGCAIMKDGECVRSGYPLDLDTLTVGSRVGMMWHADRSLHYYLDGMDMGKAWYVPHLNIYAVVDLYGQCTQVTILQNEERTFNYNGCTNLENSLIAASRAFAAPAQPYWSFSEYCGENICLTQDYTMARRKTQDPTGALVFSSAHLALDEIFEVKIMERKFGYAGSFRMGVTDINILNAHVNRSLPPSIAYLPHYTAYIDGKYLCYSKPGSRDHDMQSIVPSFEWLRPGDRVGLKKTTDQRVLIYYNCELLDVVFEKVPDKVYVVMEIFGEVVKIQTVTKTVSNALPQTIYNEDFIKRETETIQEITVTKPCEEGEDAVESSEMSCEEAASASVPTVPAPSRRHRDPLPYTFHYVHGSNIKLCSSDTVAVRTKGYKDGLAIVSQPIKRGQTFWFRVDKLEESWGGSASIGAVASLLDELPDRGTFLDPPTWLLTSDMLYDNYEFSFTNSALGLEAIREQTVLSIEFCNDNRLAVTMDGKSLGFAGTVSNDYPHVHPLIDLYGKVCQVSILLHPHVLSSGLSLDLPSIAEHKEETYSELVLPQIVPSEPEPGPSEIRTMGNIRAQSHNSLVEALETVHRQPRPRNPRFATMHHSLILPTSPGRQVHKSYSSHNFGEASGQNEGEARGFDDDPLVPEPYCDTNIQHNDRYPEANDVDNLDIEIMNALTLETGNLPDLTEEQSSSLDESTRRDDLNSDPVSAENLYYLNKLLCLDEGVEAGSLEWEWEAYGETCEHLHVVLKYWNFLVQPYPELRRAVSWGLVKCHCSNCQPDSQTSLSGWVRIERIDGVGAAARAFWPIARTTLSAARAAAGAGIARRPRALAPLPGCTPALYDTWFDEEGKPHHTALALEIDVEGSSADNDRMLAFLIYLKPHVTFVEDSPTSLEE